MPEIMGMNNPKCLIMDGKRTDNTTRLARACIARLERLVVAAPTQIVLALSHK